MKTIKTKLVHPEIYHATKVIREIFANTKIEYNRDCVVIPVWLAVDRYHNNFMKILKKDVCEFVGFVEDDNYAFVDSEHATIRTPIMSLSSYRDEVKEGVINICFSLFDELITDQRLCLCVASGQVMLTTYFAQERVKHADIIGIISLMETAAVAYRGKLRLDGWL